LNVICAKSEGYMKEIWVYPKGSATIYHGSLPEDWESKLEDFHPTYTKKGLLETLTFPDGITIERITKPVLSQRAPVWVFPQGSSTLYQGALPGGWETRTEEFYPTYNKNNLLKTLTFLDNKDQMVTIECITKQVLNQRASLWVCPKGSNQIYLSPFPEDWQDRLEAYHPTYNKKGLLETLTFLDTNNETVTVECITKQVLNQRATVWVCPQGSDHIYQGLVPDNWQTRIDEYRPTYKKRRLETLTFSNDQGHMVTIESVAKMALTKRATVWVCPKGSNRIYEEAFPEDWQTRIKEYQPTYNKNNLLETLTFSNSKEEIVTVECISKQVLSKRSSVVWVCPKGSVTLYKGTFPKGWQSRLEEFHHTNNKNGLVETLTFLGDDELMITVECITKQVLNERTGVWVYPKGSDTVYEGSFPEDWQTRLNDYRPTYNRNGLLETLTFPNSNGQMVTVECVAKVILKQRSPVWVCPKGSDNIFNGSFPEGWQTRIEEYHPTYNKNGIVETLTFTDDNEKPVVIECITKMVLKQRTAVWVCPKGSDSIYPDTIPEDWENRLEEYQPTYNKKDLIKTLTFINANKQKVTIECITKQTLSQRSAVWVYPKGSSCLYEGFFPENWQTRLAEYETTYTKNNLIKTLTFADGNGKTVTVERIAQNTLRKRIDKETNNTNKAQSSRKRKAEPLVHPERKKQKLTLEREHELTEHHIELQETPSAAPPVVNLTIGQAVKYHFFSSKQNNTNAQQNSFEEEFGPSPDEKYSL